MQFLTMIWYIKTKEDKSSSSSSLRLRQIFFELPRGVNFKKVGYAHASVKIYKPYIIKNLRKIKINLFNYKSNCNIINSQNNLFEISLKQRKFTQMDAFSIELNNLIALSK